MVLPEKNLSSPPPQKKRKALGLALSVKKNSGLARPKKKELAPFEIENRGASPIGQGQLPSTFAASAAAGPPCAPPLAPLLLALPRGAAVAGAHDDAATTNKTTPLR